MSNLFFHSVARKIIQGERFARNYRISFITLVVLCFVTAVTIFTLQIHFNESIRKSQGIRTGLSDRDLRDLISRFDLDERFVLQNNLSRMIEATRKITPVLLPRPYFQPMPASRSQTLPRQPPRNCYLNLMEVSATGVLTSSPDRFCSYFLESELPGRYMFFNVEYNDSTIVPIKYGDPRIVGDSLELTVRAPTGTGKWIIALLRGGTSDRYELSAFRILDNGIKERDRRLDGWAVVRSMNDGSQLVRIYARLDVRDFLDKSSDEVWPASGWDRLQITLARNDYTNTSHLPRHISYSEVARNPLSIAVLAAPVFETYAKFQLKVLAKAQDLSTTIDVHSGPSEKVSSNSDWIKDLVIWGAPIVRSQYVPDTDLVAQAVHPQFVVEKGALVVAALLGLLSICGVVGIGFAWWMLLRPVFRLTREARIFAAQGTDLERAPFRTYRFEIGVLAQTINDLIERLRTQIAKENAERQFRLATEAARFENERKNWLENLAILGHEIRSPLQSLINKHGPDSDSRPFIDRILVALPNLQLGLTPDQAVDSRDMTLEETDMDALLQEIAENVGTIIENVEFDMQATNVICRVDPDLLAVALDNIIQNANRLRYPNTSIIIGLRTEHQHATITVTNYGPCIEPSVKESLFKYGVTTARPEKGYGKGIGLWQAQRNIHRMQGSINAADLIDESGVCFSIHFPLVQHGTEAKPAF